MIVDIRRIEESFQDSIATHAIAVIEVSDTAAEVPWAVISWQLGQFCDSGRICTVRADHQLADALAVPMMMFSPAIVDVRLFGDDESRKPVARQAIKFAMSAVCEMGGRHHG